APPSQLSEGQGGDFRRQRQPRVARVHPPRLGLKMSLLVEEATSGSFSARSCFSSTLRMRPSISWTKLLSAHFVQEGSILAPSPDRTNAIRSICYLSFVLPEFSSEGELPPGVHVASW